MYVVFRLWLQLNSDFENLLEKKGDIEDIVILDSTTLVPAFLVQQIVLLVRFSIIQKQPNQLLIYMS